MKSAEQIKRLIFVFGKHYYALQSEKQKRNLTDTAIIRIEEICPFPAAQIRSIVAQYKNADQFIWAQEGKYSNKSIDKKFMKAALF